MKGYSKVSWRKVDEVRPIDAAQRFVGEALVPVAVEVTPGAEILGEFRHPDHALYVYGPEDGGLARGVRGQCHRFVTIPSYHCLNLSAAVCLTLYDRAVARHRAGLDPLPSIDGEERGWWFSPSLEDAHSP